MQGCLNLYSNKMYHLSRLQITNLWIIINKFSNVSPLLDPCFKYSLGTVSMHQGSCHFVNSALGNPAEALFLSPIPKTAARRRKSRTPLLDLGIAFQSPIDLAGRRIPTNIEGSLRHKLRRIYC
jgi:hypothetical protein